MSKVQDLDDMQEFVDDYENIQSTLESLLDDTNNQNLKNEVNEFINSLKEDYKNQNQDFLERISKLKNEEDDSLVREYYSMKL
jgi:hypothetical protein